ncbi:MAG: DUF1573 domain-containing protein [Flavobacteriales bacterium]|nr:DUF1573 domain-containing protein [Flavobacteriales bacterium]
MSRTTMRPLRSHIAWYGLLMLNTGLSAQSAEQWAVWGEAAMAKGDHYGASKFFSYALEREPGRMILQWDFAEACRLSHQYGPAAENYAKVARKDMGRTYPEALYLAAEMTMCTGAYADALKLWNKVLDRADDPYGFIALRARNGILGCEMGLAPDTSALELEHFPEPVNSFASEFGARTNAAGDLFLTSLRGELTDENEVVDTSSYFARIYYSGQGSGGWDTMQVVDLPLPPEGHQANLAWTRSNARRVVSYCPSDGPCRLYLVSADGRTAEPLKGADEAMSTQAMIAMVDDREMLFYTSDRHGGSGRLDLWWGELGEDGLLWTRPVGAPVNTPGNESCPWFDEASGRLYFSSDFLPGMGGYDLFTSVRKNGEFTMPENMGRPFSGPANDLYFSLAEDGRSGFITSNRVGSLAKKGETCCNDIYAFTLPDSRPLVLEEGALAPGISDVSTSALLSRLKEPLPIRLYFHNDVPDPRSWDTVTTVDYIQTYAQYRALYPEYMATHAASAEGSRSLNTFFDHEVDKGANDLERFLDLLLEALEQGVDVRIVVRGFASPLAKSDYNRNLSLRRISSLMNQLRTTRDRALVPYLAGTAASGGKLSVIKAPFGEERSAEGVSDALSDLKSSVYSVAAARERRIEIEQVLIGAKFQAQAYIVEDTIDLGDVSLGEERATVFTVMNPTDKVVNIIEVKADCGCTTAEPEQLVVPGQGEIKVPVRFNGRAPDGPFERRIVLKTDGHPGELYLVLTGVMHSE